MALSIILRCPAAEHEHLANAPAAPEKQVKSGSSQPIHEFFCGPGHSPGTAVAAATKCPQGTITPHKTSDRYQPFSSRGRIYSSPAFGHPSESSCCSPAGTDHMQAAGAPSLVLRCRSPSCCLVRHEHSSPCPRGRAPMAGSPTVGSPTAGITLSRDHPQQDQPWQGSPSAEITRIPSHLNPALPSAARWLSQHLAPPAAWPAELPSRHNHCPSHSSPGACPAPPSP